MLPFLVGFLLTLPLICFLECQSYLIELGFHSVDLVLGISLNWGMSEPQRDPLGVVQVEHNFPHGMDCFLLDPAWNFFPTLPMSNPMKFVGVDLL